MPVPKGSTIDPERTRAGIIEAASPLLYERGLDGIGVAELCSRIGVSKETLYRHFGNKDGLIQAVLEARSERVTSWIATAAAAAGEDPHDQLAAVFDELQRWYEEPTFRGCAMQNAAAQHQAEAVMGITARHLDRRLDLLTAIAQRAAQPTRPFWGASCSCWSRRHGRRRAPRHGRRGSGGPSPWWPSDPAEAKGDPGQAARSQMTLRVSATVYDHRLDGQCNGNVDHYNYCERSSECTIPKRMQGQRGRTEYERFYHRAPQ